jgi:hypothetical protein
MCDKKYMNQQDGIEEIDEFLDTNKLTPVEINVVKFIISTMSYSTVKANGFPNLGPYKRAYHIVRESDLLTAYDFDRCVIYKINKNGGDLDDAFKNANELFESRVLKHNDDNLFLFDYSKRESVILHEMAMQRISGWKRIMIRPGL